MKRFTIALLVWLVAVGADAQVRPGSFTTVNTSDSTAASVCVGCPVGSTTPASESGVTTAVVVLKNATPSITTNKLYNNAGALYFNGLALATGGTINGTTGTVPKFTGATSLGDSNATISGNNWTFASATLTATLFSGSGASLTSIPTSAVSSGNFVATVSSGTGITSSVTSGNAAATTITLNNTAVTPSTYGSTTAISVFTVDQQGRITSATTATPQLTLSSTYFSSLSAANLTSIPAANLTGTITSATQDLITRLGTIVSGVWNAGAVTSSGLLTVSGFGQSLFSAGGAGVNGIWTKNTTSGAANYAEYKLTAGTNDFYIDTLSQGYTTSGRYVQASTVIEGNGAGGLSISAVDPSGTIRFYAGGTTQVALISAGASDINGSGTFSVENPTVTFSGIGSSGTIADVVCMTSGGQLIKSNASTCVISSERFKHDIVPFSGDALSILERVHPVTYYLNDHEDRGHLLGAIAERVNELQFGAAFPSDLSLVNRDDEGRIISLQYEALTTLSVRGIQQLTERIRAIEQLLAATQEEQKR